MRQRQLKLDFLSNDAEATLRDVAAHWIPSEPFNDNLGECSPPPPANAFPPDSFTDDTCVYCGTPLHGPIAEVLGKMMHKSCEHDFAVEYNALDYDHS